MNINDLYAKARAGDSAAERELFLSLSVRFRAFVRRRGVDDCDAEDVVQNTLLAIAELFKDLKIESNFAGWAHGVLKNRLLRYFKQRSVERNRMSSEASQPEMADNTITDPRMSQAISDCLRSLHEHYPAYARILVLSCQGYSTDEICSKLRITSGNMYTTLSRARAMMRICLREKGVLHEQVHK